MSWVETARSQAGIVSRRQLVAAGVSPDAVDRMCRSGALESVAPAVFRVRGAPMTYHATLWRAVLGSGGVLGFATAAQLWGLIDDTPARVHVIVPASARGRVPGPARVHRLDVPAAARSVRTGLPVTSRTWTLLDHLGSQPLDAACSLADRAIQRGWLTRQEIERRIERLPGRWGNGRLRQVAAVVGDGAAAQSERVLHRLLRGAGVGGWLANQDVWHDGQLLGVADVLFPAHGLAVEVDGMAHHTAPDRFQRDRSRQNAFVAAGWTVLRFTWADLTQRPGYVVSAIRRQLGSGQPAAESAAR